MDKAEKDLNHLTQTGTQRDPTLSQLLALSQRYEALDEKIQGVLSQKLLGQVRVACVRDDVLVMAAHSSAWVARTQLEAQEILKAARNHWPEPLSAVKVVVGPGG